jgi:hypothetical protein
MSVNSFTQGNFFRTLCFDIELFALTADLALYVLLLHAQSRFYKNLAYSNFLLTSLRMRIKNFCTCIKYSNCSEMKAGDYFTQNVLFVMTIRQKPCVFVVVHLVLRSMQRCDSPLNNSTLLSRG